MLRIKDIVLVLIKEAGGKIQGRTLLQKYLYFLENMLLDVHFGFRPHYYGPYSPYIDNAIGELIGLRFIEEHRMSYGINEEGFEVKRYDYEITEDGENIIKYIQDKNETDYNKIKESFRRILEFSKDYLVLSIAAKIHYILKEYNRPMTEEEILKEGEKLNWNISQKQKQLKEAVEFLKRLNLVEVT